MNQLIPEFDFNRVFVGPWATDVAMTLPIVLMGFFVAAACGLVGNFLLLRRMALIGDAISHSILPGLVVAFVLFKSLSIWVAMAGALSAGVATVVVIEFIHRHSRIKPDAAICIAFTTFFALGVAMMSMLESRGGIHLDAECVLYGEISFVGLAPRLDWLGMDWGPIPVARMGFMLLVVLLLVTVFYKELMITSFDPALADSLGMGTRLWHYGMMGVLALVIVCAFEAVGAILAVAMLIVPPMFAAQLSDRLSVRLLLTSAHALVSAVLGLHLSIWLECSTAGAMVVAGAGLFAAVWLWSLLRSIRTPSPAPAEVVSR
jgi:manganese/zinc/iron transport system permease protein